MSKTPHRTPKKKESAKYTTKTDKPSHYDARMFEEKLDIVTFRKIPISDGYIETLAENAVKSALHDKDDLVMMGYFYEHGHFKTDIARWSERNEKFRDLVEMRRKIIGAKREAGALLQDQNNKYHRLKDTLVRFTMPFYEESWREREKELAKDKMEDAAAENSVIVIEKFPGEK